jgi:DNA-binding transcriptional LysR family regulator
MAIARHVPGAGTVGCIMELRHLRYFLAVARERHVTRAAESLGIQQPPLSTQISALERELGVQLFRRLPRGVELTVAGQIFQKEVEAILAHVEQARSLAQGAARGEIGRLALGFTTSTPFHPFVPRLIRAFNTVNRSVAMAMEEDGSVELLESLNERRIDAAFIRTPVPTPHRMNVLRLLEEDMVVALPRAHPLAAQRARDLRLDELTAETIISYRRPNGPGLFDSVLAACHAGGFNPNLGQETPRISSALNLVSANLGISIVPASLKRMRMDGVVYRKVRGLDFRAPIMLVALKDHPSPILQHFFIATRRMIAQETDRVGTAKAAPNDPAPAALTGQAKI